MQKKKKIRIDFIKHEEKISQGGKKYTLCSIKTGDFWLSGFGNSTTQTWVQNDEVEVYVETVQKDGKTYYNFSIPSKENLLLERIDTLEKRVTALESGFSMKTPVRPSIDALEKRATAFEEAPPPEEYPGDPEIPEDLPF